MIKRFLSFYNKIDNEIHSQKVKYCEDWPMSYTLTALQVAKMFFKHIFKYPGMLADIVSNRYPHFTTLFRQELFNLLDTHAHPQTDGQTKRVNHRLEDYIRCYVQADQKDLLDHIDMLEFCYNSSKYSATGKQVLRPLALVSHVVHDKISDNIDVKKMA